MCRCYIQLILHFFIQISRLPTRFLKINIKQFESSIRNPKWIPRARQYPIGMLLVGTNSMVLEELQHSEAFIKIKNNKKTIQMRWFRKKYKNKKDFSSQLEEWKRNDNWVKKQDTVGHTHYPKVDLFTLLYISLIILIFIVTLNLVILLNLLWLIKKSRNSDSIIVKAIVIFYPRSHLSFGKTLPYWFQYLFYALQVEWYSNGVHYLLLCICQEFNAL